MEEALVEEAVSNAAVEEANKEMGEPCNHSAVLVPLVVCPQCVACENGSTVTAVAHAEPVLEILPSAEN